MSGGHVVQNLLRWLKTFDAAKSIKSVDDVSDGIVLGEVLYTISPKHFSREWLCQLHSGTHLSCNAKVENLEYIVRAIEEFLSQVPDQSIVLHPLPDLLSIANYNAEDAAFRLLQLVLGCAVTCENKDLYIEAIMGMEESVQQVLMEAIQELMTSARLSNLSGAFQDGSENRLLAAATDCKGFVLDQETLERRCCEMEKLVTTLQEENSNLRQLLERSPYASNRNIISIAEHDVSANLLLSSSGIETSDPDAKMQMSPTVASVRISQLQDQLTKFRNELYRVEGEKEELKIKLTDSQATATSLRQKCEILTRKSEEAVHLKDELDIAREELAAVAHLTTTMDQLRRRADEAVELRVRCAKLETDNKVLVDRLAELEQESRLSGNLRCQAETQRLQAADARQAAAQASARADTAETELRRLRDELAVTSREKLRLVNELNRLRSCCEQLQRCAPPASALNEELQSLESGSSGMMYTPAMQSQMLNLREELTRLRASLSSLEIAADASAIEEDASLLATENEHRIMQTSDLLDVSGSYAGDDQPQHESDAAPSSVQVLTMKHEEMMDGQLIASLREQLSEKDRAFEQMEQQYRNYLWKARNLVLSLQRQLRTQTESAESLNGESSDVARLRSLLVEKECIIENLERHIEQTRLRHDAEERILLAAWYNRGVRQTREVIEQQIRERQAQPVSKSESMAEHAAHNNGVGDMSFLERQREMHLKPPRGLTSIVMASK